MFLRDAREARRGVGLRAKGALTPPQVKALADEHLTRDWVDLGPGVLLHLDRPYWLGDRYHLFLPDPWPKELRLAAHEWEQWCLSVSTAGAIQTCPGWVVPWPHSPLERLFHKPLERAVLLAGWLLWGADADLSLRPDQLARAAGVPVNMAVRWLTLQGVEGWQEAS